MLDHSTPVRTIVDRQELGAIPKRLSSTDPQLLDYSETTLNVGRISSTEVFREDRVSSESSQEDTSVNMDRRQCEEQAYILKQKGRKVAREMAEFVEDDLSTSRITVMEAELARIRDLKSDYQDSIEAFLDLFGELIGSKAVETWNKELLEVGKTVKAHANKIRTRAAQITTAVTTNDANSARALQIQETSLQLQQLSLDTAKETNQKEQKRTLKDSFTNLWPASDCINILTACVIARAWRCLYV